MNRIVHIIIYFLIIGIFIFNSPEYAYNLGIIPIRLEDSPFFIKIGKDVGIILLVIIGYIHILYRRKKAPGDGFSDRKRQGNHPELPEKRRFGDRI